MRSGLEGGLRTLRWGAEAINVNVRCPGVERPIRIKERRFTNRRPDKTAVCKPPLLDYKRKLRPDRRVIGRFLALAHLALDARGGAMFRQRFARENRIDPQSAIFGKGEHPVIPPAKKAGLGMMDPQRVGQIRSPHRSSNAAALTVRTHDCATPQIGVVNILVLRRDIEIAANGQVLLSRFHRSQATSAGVAYHFNL